MELSKSSILLVFLCARAKCNNVIASNRCASPHIDSSPNFVLYKLLKPELGVAERAKPSYCEYFNCCNSEDEFIASEHSNNGNSKYPLVPDFSLHNSSSKTNASFSFPGANNNVLSNFLFLLYCCCTASRISDSEL